MNILITAVAALVYVVGLAFFAGYFTARRGYSWLEVALTFLMAGFWPVTVPTLAGIWVLGIFFGFVKVAASKVFDLGYSL